MPEFSLSFLSDARISQTDKILRGFTPGFNDALWSTVLSVQSSDLRQLGRDSRSHWYEGPDDPHVTILGQLMGGCNAAFEAGAYDTSDRAALENEFEFALCVIRDKIPEFYSVIDRSIFKVIFARRAGFSGGTVSSRIGLIWLAPERDWTCEKWVENIVHEFVHNALFLEDMVYGVLAFGGDRLEEPDARATSAIRRVKRGYDKAFHSAFVALTLAELYIILDDFESAASFVDPLVICVEDVVRLRRFATSHGQALLEELARKTLAVRSSVQSRRTSLSALA